MKKIVLFYAALFFGIHLAQAQNPKEEAFVKQIYEVIKKNDKKALVENLMLKESDLDQYNESQKALGSTKVMTKDDFKKFLEDKNSRIIRNFDELLKNAVKGKVTFENTVFQSYKKVSDANAELPAGFYKILLTLHNTYTVKMNVELCPMGDGFKLFFLEDRMNVTM